MNVVGYVRLSRDEDKENYSSIITQKNIIKEYSNKKKWIIDKLYIDDNCSGYTFNRPQFSEMLSQIKSGKINVIIAKDLSRIGRNNGKVLLFIDKLRKLNIRLILVEEASGGLDLLEDNDDIIGIKTWYNEMYVKDISRKIRSSMHIKQKNGNLIIGNYYGYKKVKVNNSFKLIVDDEIKSIVQLIFEKYIQGLGYKKICDLLNERGCLTPSEYIQKNHEKSGKIFKNSVTHRWQTYMINRIIKNDLYIGTLRTKKRQSRMIKGRQETVDKEKQYVFENNHEAIISKDDFKLAQEINNKRNKKSYSGKSKYNYMFSSFIKCGECGYSVVGCNLRSYPVIIRGYNCTTYRRYGNTKCSNHAISEEKVLFFFKEFLKDIKEEYREYISSIKFSQNKDDLKQRIDRIKKELIIQDKELKFILSEKIKDLMQEEREEYRKIIEDTYSKIEYEKKKSILSLVQNIKKLEDIRNSQVKNNLRTAVDAFDSIINSETLSHENVERILDKIIIYNDKNLEFKLKVDIKKLT